MIKVIFGIGIGLYYYFLKEQAGDTFEFFNSTLKILDHSPLEIYNFIVFSETDLIFDTSRTALFIKFLIPIVWISAKNYWLSCILIASLSYLILFLIYLRYAEYLKEFNKQLIFSFFIFPSVLFWTSGIFKESLVFILLLLSLVAFLDFVFKNKTKPLILLTSLVSFYLFFQIRYFLAVFVFAIFGLIISSGQNKLFKYASMSIAFLVLISVIFFHPVLNPVDFPHFLQNAHQNVLGMTDSSLDTYYDFSEDNWYGILSNLPMAFVNAFLRPFPWEWASLQQLLYSLENYILISGFVIFAYPFKERKKSNLSVILIIVLVLIFLSLATPNFGSLYRYKSVCLPFLMFFFIKNSRFLSLKKTISF